MSSFDYTFSEGDNEAARPFQVRNSQNITFENSLFDGDTASGAGEDVDGFGSAHALVVNGSSGIEITDNEFTTFKRAMVLSESDTLTVTGNDIHSMRSDGINLAAVQSVLIEDNYIHDFRKAEGTSDHADMIQMWSSGTTVPSTDITVRGNTLDASNNETTQSIFMRNEMVDAHGAGDAMFYKNILIEDNTILNGHLHGITVGETDGLTIRQNSVLAVEGADTNPSIILKSDSRNVTVEQNAAWTINGYENQAGWTLSNNALVQNTDPNAPGFYGQEFLSSSTNGGVDGFIVDPEGTIAKLGAGSPRLTLETKPEALSPAFDLATDPADSASIVLDATHTYGPSGQITDGDATFVWDLGDGTTATGQQVKHNYASPGNYEVTLTVETGDGSKATANGDLAVAGNDVLSFDATTGFFQAEGYGSEDAITGTDSASVGVAGGYGVDIDGSGKALSIPREDMGRFFGSEAFDLSMTVAADSIGNSGELARIHGSLILSVTDGGDVKLRFWTDSDDAVLQSSGLAVNDGAAHDIGIGFDGSKNSLQLLVDGQVVAAEAVAGNMKGRGILGSDIRQSLRRGELRFDTDCVRS